MGSGELFHKEGPIYDKVFCPVLVLQKGYSNLAITCVYYTMRRTFKIFFQIKRTAVIDKLKSYRIYSFVLFGGQPIYRSKLHKRYNAFYLI